MFSKIMTMKSTNSCWDNAEKVKNIFKSADAVVIGQERDCQPRWAGH